MPPVPARPCLEFNLLRGPVQQVINTARQAKLGLSFAPEGEGASQALAQAYDDIARAIQADSRAHLARQWAFERAAKCGWGVYRILTEYVNEQTFDQKILYKRVLNQASAYLDPFAQEPDWSRRAVCAAHRGPAASRAISGRTRTVEARALHRPRADLARQRPADVDHDQSHGSAGLSCRVAEYWEVREETRDAGAAARRDDGASRRRSRPTSSRRSRRTAARRCRGARITTGRQVFWSLINGVEVIQGPQEWNGSYIPIIPVIGDEANLNGDRRWTGIVQFARDAQQSYNYMRSAQVEAVGLAPRAQWLIADGQLEGYEALVAAGEHAQPAVSAVSARRPTAGSPAPPPQRNVAEPAIQAVTLAAAGREGRPARDDEHAAGVARAARPARAQRAWRSARCRGRPRSGSSGYLDNLASV